MLFVCALFGALSAPQAQFWPPTTVQRSPARCNPARHIPYLQPSDTPTTVALTLDGSSEMNAALARRVPGGFAGVWYDREQRINVNLVDTASARAMLQALAAYVPAGNGSRGTVTRAGLLAARTHAVRWTAAELEDWFGTLAAAAIDLDSFGMTSTPDGPQANVVGLVDIIRNQLVYVAIDTTVLARVDRTLSRQGLPCGLVRLEVWSR